MLVTLVAKLTQVRGRTHQTLIDQTLDILDPTGFTGGALVDSKPFLPSLEIPNDHAHGVVEFGPAHRACH